MKNYDDIINLPHYRSSKRQPMSMEARAAQFAPFAALSGHEEAIEETARFTDTKPELTDDELRMLSLRLNAAMSMSPRPVVKIVFFRPDASKKGGAYMETKGRIAKVDQIDRLIVLEDKSVIPLDCVMSIDVKVPKV